MSPIEAKEQDHNRFFIVFFKYYVNGFGNHDGFGNLPIYTKNYSYINNSDVKTEIVSLVKSGHIDGEVTVVLTNIIEVNFKEMKEWYGE